MENKTETVIEIAEGQEIIAQFMNLKSFNDNRYGKLWSDPFGKNQSQFSLQYDKSFDWLMPVIEKIETLRMDVTIKHFITNTGRVVQECLIDDQSGNTIAFQEGKTKIEAVNKTVLEFLRWYYSSGGGNFNNSTQTSL